jgi:hypothetical protein
VVEENGGCTRLGIVIRDSHGIMLVARCVTRMGCLNPAIAEALVMLASFQLCKELGLTLV